MASSVRSDPVQFLSSLVYGPPEAPGLVQSDGNRSPQVSEEEGLSRCPVRGSRGWNTGCCSESDRTGLNRTWACLYSPVLILFSLNLFLFCEASWKEKLDSDGPVLYVCVSAYSQHMENHISPPSFLSQPLPPPASSGRYSPTPKSMLGDDDVTRWARTHQTVLRFI